VDAHRSDVSALEERRDDVVRINLQQDLDQIEATIHEEGTLVLRALAGALTALVQQDSELADEVIAFDDEVDQRYFSIEEQIQNLLARQTPVAGDLRLVLAMLHVNLHLERMADYCVTIAKLEKLAPTVAPDRLFVDAFREMGERAQEMIKVALEAFAKRDAEQAATLVDLDELIDRANRRFVQHILSYGRDPRLHEWGLRMLIVSRCFERIGDHAVDIGERVDYMATGEFREFTDASHKVDLRRDEPE
jgi:phosphate transport system protein